MPADSALFLPQPARTSRASSPTADHLDEETVAAIKRGERGAWEAAYLTYGPGLMGFLTFRLGDRDDASEALSETFLRAIEKVSNLRGGADSFRAWLFRIARNVSIDRMRARARVTVTEDLNEAPDVLTGGPADLVVAEEEAAQVRSALADLSDHDREVVWLRICVGLSSDQVGDIVGKRPGAVRMQQLRALESMARTFDR